jgi:carboxymethylenebutenolidase
MGEYVDMAVEDGRAFRAYVTTPSRGSGPGIVLLHEVVGLTGAIRQHADLLAEEGYVVVVPDLYWRKPAPASMSGEPGDDADAQRLGFDAYRSLDIDRCIGDVVRVVRYLRARPEHVGKVAAVGYCLGGLVAVLAAVRIRIDCGVGFYPLDLDNHLSELMQIDIPFGLHLAGDDEYSSEATQAAVAAAADGHQHLSIDVYEGARHPFASPNRPGFDVRANDLGFARMIELLRASMGPHYDLNALWDEHLRLEFETKDAGATLTTMVDEPYVNHIPTMTGGTGFELLARFYKYHFVDHNPDQRVIPISRTVGPTRVVDEFVACFTHDREIPWLLPGVAPTGKYVEIPIVSVVGFRGDKLHHEHIYWDQASLLVQLGLLDADLPVAGVEVARKALDENLPSNELMAADWATSEGLPIPSRSPAPPSADSASSRSTKPTRRH